MDTHRYTHEEIRKHLIEQDISAAIWSLKLPIKNEWEKTVREYAKRIVGWLWNEHLNTERRHFEWHELLEYGAENIGGAPWFNWNQTLEWHGFTPETEPEDFLWMQQKAIDEAFDFLR